MHRNKQRRQPQPLNAIPFPLRQIGEGEIGAIEKTQPIIIIFVIKRCAFTGRLLINKTKGTAVIALNQTIKQGRFKFQAQLVVIVLFNFNQVGAIVLIQHFQLQHLIGTEEVVINQISGFLAIDGHQPIAHFKPHLLGN